MSKRRATRTVSDGPGAPSMRKRIAAIASCRPSSIASEPPYVSPAERSAIALEAALPVLERIAAALEKLTETEGAAA